MKGGHSSIIYRERVQRGLTQIRESSAFLGTLRVQEEDQAMSNSKYLASLIGPILLAVTVAELVNVRIFSSNTAPVVFFNGMVLLAAGFAIVRAHNKWMWEWTLMVTLVGWGLTFLGLFRMLAPEAQMAASENGKLIGILFPLLIAVFLTYFGYRRER